MPLLSGKPQLDVQVSAPDRGDGTAEAKGKAIHGSLGLTFLLQVTPVYQNLHETFSYQTGCITIRTAARALGKGSPVPSDPSKIKGSQ